MSLSTNWTTSDFKAYICFYMYLLSLNHFGHVYVALQLIVFVILCSLLFLFCSGLTSFYCKLASYFHVLLLFVLLFLFPMNSNRAFLDLFVDRWKTCLATVLVAILDIVGRRKSNLICPQQKLTLNLEIW